MTDVVALQALAYKQSTPHESSPAEVQIEPFEVAGAAIG